MPIPNEIAALGKSAAIHKNINSKKQATDTTNSDNLATAKETLVDTKFKNAIDLRRKAGMRRKELFRLAMVRNGSGFRLDANAWAYVLAATRACMKPGLVPIPNSRRSFRQRGLDILTLKDDLRECRIFEISDDDLAMVIKAVERFKAQNGARLIPQDTAARLLNISEHERFLAKIKTIGAVDMTREQRQQMNKLEKKLWHREHKRAMRGAKPRAIYEGNSLSRTEPWTAEGISRRTWYRRKELSEMVDNKGNGTGMSPHLYNITPEVTHLCQVIDRIESETAANHGLNLGIPVLAGVPSGQGHSKGDQIRKFHKKENGHSEGGECRANEGARERDQSASTVTDLSQYRMKTVPIWLRMALPGRTPPEPQPKPNCWTMPCPGGWRWVTKEELVERWPHLFEVAA